MAWIKRRWTYAAGAGARRAGAGAARAGRVATAAHFCWLDDVLVFGEVLLCGVDSCLVCCWLLLLLSMSKRSVANRRKQDLYTPPASLNARGKRDLCGGACPASHFDGTKREGAAGRSTHSPGSWALASAVSAKARKLLNNRELDWPASSKDGARWQKQKCRFETRKARVLGCCWRSGLIYRDWQIVGWVVKSSKVTCGETPLESFCMYAAGRHYPHL